MRHQGYMTRALRARDPRFARILGKLGYETRDEVAADEQEPVTPKATRSQLDHDGDGRPGGSKKQPAEVAALREEYLAVVGKKPFNGWDAATLQAKIAEKRSES